MYYVLNSLEQSLADRALLSSHHLFSINNDFGIHCGCMGGTYTAEGSCKMTVQRHTKLDRAIIKVNKDRL